MKLFETCVTTARQATQVRFALDLRWERGLGRVIKALRNNIAQALVRALSVVMVLDGGQCTAQMGLTQQNQWGQRLPNFSHMPFRIRMAARCVGGNFENAQFLRF